MPVGPYRPHPGDVIICHRHAKPKLQYLVYCYVELHISPANDDLGVNNTGKCKNTGAGCNELVQTKLMFVNLRPHVIYQNGLSMGRISF